MLAQISLDSMRALTPKGYEGHLDSIPPLLEPRLIRDQDSASLSNHGREEQRGRGPDCIKKEDLIQEAPPATCGRSRGGGGPGDASGPASVHMRGSRHTLTSATRSQARHPSQSSHPCASLEGRQRRGQPSAKPGSLRESNLRAPESRRGPLLAEASSGMRRSGAASSPKGPDEAHLPPGGRRPSHLFPAPSPAAAGAHYPEHPELAEFFESIRDFELSISQLTGT